MAGRGPPWARLLALLSAAFIAAAAEDAPIVTTEQGQVQGRCVEQSGTDFSYFAFEGIPFAAPPVGSRRFKGPEEPEPWSGIRNATQAGPICIQKNLFTRQVEGEEDCLFINVYATKINSEQSKHSWKYHEVPVVVWIHASYFTMGWGNLDWLRPDALLKQGMMLVTFNYRLGVMGFLNTLDSQAPGNAGIKDALMALRWVQKNIGAFGGDPKRVTIVGNEAGGVIANHLLLSPQSKGLFRAAASMDGVALSPWAHDPDPRASAEAMKECFAAACSNDSDAEPCLQSVPARDLVAAQDCAPPPHWKFLFWKTPFLPSLEAPGSSAAPLITSPPEQLMRAGRFQRLPYIAGFMAADSNSWLDVIAAELNTTEWTHIEDNFNDTFIWAMPPGLQTTEAVSAMRSFYLGNRSLEDAPNDIDTKYRFVMMCSDLLVAVSTVSAARLLAQSLPSVYLYEFAAEGPPPPPGAPRAPWAALGADALWLLAPPAASNGSDAAESVRERWARLFADFASTGKPSSRNNPDYPKWKPYTPMEEKYMQVNNKFTVKSRILGKRIEFWRQLAQCQTAGVCEQNPVVHTAQGLLRGQRKQSVAGCSYYSWNGIPYATPPVGPLRFKDAQLPEPWEGVRDALEDGKICHQPSMGTNGSPDGGVVGEEDCLYMNVHTPQMPTWLEDSLPIMVWIHGGAFVVGSGIQSVTGPDYLICEKVIIVTINYRMSAFGFLYFEEAAPGNVGLKDQVAALRWVQRNIAAFLGEPGRVTVAGESAGAASVHLLVLSPSTKDLFQRAIMQSGNAVGKWAVQTEPLETSQRLADACNCLRNDSFETVDCLRQVPATTLLLAALGPALTDFDRNRLQPVTFVPTNDLPVPGVELFLPAPAIEIVKNNLYHPVPLLMGFTSQESLSALLITDFRREPQARVLDASWDTKILPELSLPVDAEKNEQALKDMRQFYMNGEPLSNNTLIGFLDMLTDILMGKAVYFSLRIMADTCKGPFHEYIFDVSDALNTVKILANATDIPGAAHVEDVNYLFRVETLPEVSENSTAALSRRRMVRLWTNYVKLGDPTPCADPLLQGVDWKPYTKHQSNYLRIGNDLKPGRNLNKKRDEFWKQFYNEYL